MPLKHVFIIRHIFSLKSNKNQFKGHLNQNKGGVGYEERK